MNIFFHGIFYNCKFDFIFELIISGKNTLISKKSNCLRGVQLNFMIKVHLELLCMLRESEPPFKLFSGESQSECFISGVCCVTEKLCNTDVL